MGTVAELSALWLADRGPAGPDRELGPIGNRVSPHWRRTRRSLAKHLCAAIGEVTLNTLGPRDVWTLQEYCLCRGLSAETTNKTTHHLLPAMLRDFEASGLIPRGTKAIVMEGVRKLRLAGERRCIALSMSERDRVVRAFAGHWAQPLVCFLFYTGVRIGEACGLRQRDLDWTRRTCRVMRSRRRDELSATKSRRSQRVLELPLAAVAAISPLRCDEAPEAFVFLGAQGAPLDADVFRRRTWGPRLRRAGLRPIRLHDCRHTFATGVLEAGMPAAKVAAYLGDKQSTVEERYSHVALAGDWDSAIQAPARLRRVQ